MGLASNTVVPSMCASLEMIAIDSNRSNDNPWLDGYSSHQSIKERRASCLLVLGYRHEAFLFVPNLLGGAGANTLTSNPYSRETFGYTNNDHVGGAPHDHHHHTNKNKKQNKKQEHGKTVAERSAAFCLGPHRNFCLLSGTDNKVVKKKKIFPLVLVFGFVFVFFFFCGA